MKRILAATLLLISFTSVAFADGAGLPPKPTKPPKAAMVLADGAGLPPKGTKYAEAAIVRADGAGLPPKPTKPPQATTGA